MISTIKTLPDYANEGVIHDLYVTKGLSVAQVAELTLASRTAVLASLERFKIPTRAPHLFHGRHGNPPFGYHMVGGQLVGYPKEKKVIQAVKKMYLEEKLSLNAIARALTRSGIPTKKTKGPWHHEMVRAILKREKLA
ncbi:recombinase family protein [Bdellovibrionota bacterium FG-1]